MKIKLDGFIMIPGHSETPMYVGTDMSGYGFVMVGKINTEIDFDLPVGWSKEAAEIESINDKLERMANEYHSSVKQLKGRISELQSLPMTLQEQAA